MANQAAENEEFIRAVIVQDLIADTKRVRDNIKEEVEYIQKEIPGSNLEHLRCQIAWWKRKMRLQCQSGAHEVSRVRTTKIL